MTVQPDSATDTARPEWMRRPERGSATLLRFMTWLSLTLGRRLTRPIVYGIAGYFLLASPGARTASRTYLGRSLGRAPGWRDLFRHFMAFASTVHDRIYLLNDRHDLFDIRIHGEMVFPKNDTDGFLIFGAHLGSFEALRAMARKRGLSRIYAAMYPENARQLNRMLAAINPAVMDEIIALGPVDAVFTISDKIASGAAVTLLVDRNVRNEQFETLPFLGVPAPFASGPFRLAALLHRPVYFMTCLYHGGNRYDIHIEPLADFARLPAGARAQAQKDAMLRYAQLLEHYCRLAPYNWFNFFDFWEGTEHETA